MAHRSNHTPRRKARQTQNFTESLTTTSAILDTNGLKPVEGTMNQTQIAGGTLIRMMLDIDGITAVGADNARITLWGIVADSDSVIADLPDPTLTTDLDLFARYHFVTVLACPAAADSPRLDDGGPSWHVDVKSKARLEDNQRLFICGKVSSGTSTVTGLKKFWWMQPKA